MQISKPGILSEYQNPDSCTNKVLCMARMYQIESAMKAMLAKVSNTPNIEMVFSGSKRRALAPAPARVKVDFTVKVANNTDHIFNKNFSNSYATSFNNVVYPKQFVGVTPEKTSAANMSSTSPKFVSSVIFVMSSSNTTNSSSDVNGLLKKLADKNSVVTALQSVGVTVNANSLSLTSLVVHRASPVCHLGTGVAHSSTNCAANRTLPSGQTCSVSCNAGYALPECDAGTWWLNDCVKSTDLRSFTVNSLNATVQSVECVGGRVRLPARPCLALGCTNEFAMNYNKFVSNSCPLSCTHSRQRTWQARLCCNSNLL